MPRCTIHIGDCLESLRAIPDESVHSCITSPPYWGLRDYGTAEWEGGSEECDHQAPPTGGSSKNSTLDGTGNRDGFSADGQYRDACAKCGARRVDLQLGLEPTPEAYVARMVEIFREVRRVLRSDGTLWLNLGDSFYGGKGQNGSSKARATAHDRGYTQSSGTPLMATRPLDLPQEGLKPKDLVGIPWRVAFALQSDGWYLRSDIIWCLSGGTKVYARTQKGEMPMSIKDMVRLEPHTVQLWNGEKWTQVLGWNESKRGEPLEIELRSGERIGCTEGHLWPTQRGNVRADELLIGDVIQTTNLPEPQHPFSPALIGRNVAWMLGLYLAEGSRDDRGRLQFAGHTDQREDRIGALRPLAEAFGGTVRSHGSGNTDLIIMDCPPLSAMVDQYIHGRSAKTKGIKVRAWSHSDDWLDSLLRGYLAGDGHHDEKNGRWRLGFTRNDRLADDLRTLAARLGYTLTLKATHGTGFGRLWPIYRGELRMDRSGHHNERPRSEVVAIRKSRGRKFWDIGVADEPHTFALASGVLTHNSKPNPMPESVTDRPTKAHEYIFLLTKSARYFYEAEAIKEDAITAGGKAGYAGYSATAESMGRLPSGNEKPGMVAINEPTRNRRSVWTIATQPFPGAHFAVFPPTLIEPCILAGTSEKGCCAECGAPVERVVERSGQLPIDDSEEDQGRMKAGGIAATDTARRKALSGAKQAAWKRENPDRLIGWKPTCTCNAGTNPCTVLDPFGGSGTTGMVAAKKGRDSILCELNPEYAAMASQRVVNDAPMFNTVRIIPERIAA